MVASDRTVRVVVLNQHGDNRGDEAALRAMLGGIEGEVRRRTGAPVAFTVLHQFARGHVAMTTRHDVTWIDLRPRPVEAVRLAAFLVCLVARWRFPRVLGAWGRSVLDAYDGADVAVSAPGGPYFGDPYADHEIVHWMYVWLAARLGLPAALYAPSVGPFRHRMLNPVRRRMFRRFDCVSVREDVSYGYLHDLVPDLDVVLAADSALQDVVEAADRETYFADRPDLAERLVVGVSAIDWRYPGHPDPAGARSRYDDVVVDCLAHLHARHGAHLLAIPQLYGAVHTDVAYLESLLERLPPSASWEVFDPDADSDAQRAAFSMCDVYFASRYHPQIFATAGGVPGVCIYYEHKALGYARAVGVEHLAFPIEAVDASALRAALDDVIANRERYGERIRTVVAPLRDMAAASTTMVADLVC